MKLSPEEILNIAKLARLEIKDDDVNEYSDQLSSILEYVEKLQELDTENVPELQHALDIKNVFREDEVNECSEEVRQKCLDNFTSREGDLLEAQAVFSNN